jgi:5-methylcytosine-specific restriction endonuclease McrA
MRVLLLNQNYELLDFIKIRRALRLIVKNKVEVISNWAENIITFASGFINYPSILRLKNYIQFNPRKIYYSRSITFKRDKYTCVYCGKKYKNSDLTIDHIIPRSCGGESNFLNCVTCCQWCNRKKANKTLEQSGMKLLFEPYIPEKYICFANEAEIYNEEWTPYIRRSG